MSQDTDLGMLSVDELREIDAKKLSDAIEEELGFRVPIEQIKTYEFRKFKRLIKYLALFKGDDFAQSNKLGFRTEEIDSEPGMYWISIYKSLDLVYKRKANIGTNEDGPYISMTDEEMIMVVRLEDGTCKKIKIVTTYDSKAEVSTSEFFELEMEV